MRSSVALACRRGVAVLGLGVAGVIVSAGVAAADDDALGSALTGAVSLEQTLTSVTEPVLDTVGTTEQVLDPAVDLLEPAVTVVEPVTEATEPVTTAVQSDTSSVVDTVPVAEVVNPVVTVVDPVVEVVEVVDPVVEVVDPVIEVLDPVVEVVDPVIEVLDPVIEVIDPVTEVLDPVAEAVDPVTDTLPVANLPGEVGPGDVAADSAGIVRTADSATSVTPDSPRRSTDGATNGASAQTGPIHRGASLAAGSWVVTDSVEAGTFAPVSDDSAVSTPKAAPVFSAPLAAPAPAASSSSAGIGGPARASVDAWSYERLSLPASVTGSLAIAENLRAPRAPFLEIPTSPA